MERKRTIRASPNSQRRYLWFLSALQLKIKGRDCGTINGHNESLSIRTLMKDAREVLVRAKRIRISCTFCRYSSRGLTLYYQRIAEQMVILFRALAG